MKYHIQVFIPTEPESKVGQWHNTAFGGDNPQQVRDTAISIARSNRQGIVKVRIMEQIQEFDCEQ
jgi:hypothetical protein